MACGLESLDDKNKETAPKFEVRTPHAPVFIVFKSVVCRQGRCVIEVPGSGYRVGDQVEKKK